MAARGALVECEHPVAGVVRSAAPPVRLSETPGAVRSPAPLLGEHTEQVLRERLGMTQAEIARLRARSGHRRLSAALRRPLFRISATLSGRDGGVVILHDRVAIITGASKGIGRRDGAIVRSRRRGRRLCGAIGGSRQRDRCGHSIGRADGRLRSLPTRAPKTGARAIVDAGAAAFGHVDTLVNNAGDGGPTKPVQDYTTDDWFYTINSCLTSAYLCTRFVVPAMIAAGRGAIVNIASMAGRRGLAYRVGYCSAKAGQIGMTYGLALELGATTSRSTRSRPARWQAIASTA